MTRTVLGVKWGVRTENGKEKLWIDAEDVGLDSAEVTKEVLSKLPNVPMTNELVDGALTNVIATLQREKQADVIAKLQRDNQANADTIDALKRESLALADFVATLQQKLPQEQSALKLPDIPSAIPRVDLTPAWSEEEQYQFEATFDAWINSFQTSEG